MYKSLYFPTYDKTARFPILKTAMNEIQLLTSCLDLPLFIALTITQIGDMTPSYYKHVTSIGTDIVTLVHHILEYSVINLSLIHI